ncbi:hypothetical protein FE697_005100 [Mumia zhuanghuii]|uniref:Solute:sodium symporter small subunit n=2 Tax=Mumia TaxID=1546255 RepID=A0ABW1QPY4_9ACTN|nr:MULTISPECIES: hypothetical protein [Mumia]KAA1425247.1 hypothetical protein FE697_005100 [Mumia zhuanghuii]
MAESDQPPPRARVRVTSPHTTLRPHRRRTVVQEIDEETEIGEVYMRSLIRSQLRLALIVSVVVALLVGGLPILFVLVDLDALQVGPVPLPWWILGAAVYPVLFVIGWVFVAASERNERAFSDLVERP